MSVVILKWLARVFIVCAALFILWPIARYLDQQWPVYTDMRVENVEIKGLILYFDVAGVKARDCELSSLGQGWRLNSDVASPIPALLRTRDGEEITARPLLPPGPFRFRFSVGIPAIADQHGHPEFFFTWYMNCGLPWLTRFDWSFDVATRPIG